MHRLMYSIEPNQMSLCSFQVVKKKKVCVQKHIKKAHSTIYNTLQSLQLMLCP